MVAVFVVRVLHENKLSRLRPAGCWSGRISDLSAFGVSH
jgi:hypothetical protein